MLSTAERIRNVLQPFEYRIIVTPVEEVVGYACSMAQAERVLNGRQGRIQYRARGSAEEWLTC